MPCGFFVLCWRCSGSFKLIQRTKLGESKLEYIKDNGKGSQANDKICRAVVAGIMNKQCQALLSGQMIRCIVPGSLITSRNSLAVGDEVEVVAVSEDQYKLLNILPRKTALYRGDRRSLGEKILIAANVGYLLAVVTADYLISQAGYFEAAIISARRAGIRAGLFVSRWDLIGDNAKAVLLEKLELYRNVADTVSYGSSHDVSEELIQAVRGKVTVVLGDRASGKTTLIHSILNKLQQAGCCREATMTSHSNLLHTGSDNTWIIDTPGFRSFVLSGVTQQERALVFSEIAELEEQCRFANCTHTYEEDCRVLEGLRTGKVKRVRYDACKRMTDDAPLPVVSEKGAPRVDYRHTACTESFVCKACGMLVVPGGAGSQHRNHCPHCLCSVHVDNKPGDRAALCYGVMEPVSVWVRKGGEWAIIHRCRLCGTLSSNRVAADDNPMLLMSIAVKPLSMPPFPLDKLATL